MKLFEVIKQIVTILTMLVALYQMFISNDQRARENVATAEKVYSLSQQIEAQQTVMEAAFKCNFE